MKATTTANASAKAKLTAQPVKLKTPKGANNFGAFVASKVKTAAETTPPPPVSPKASATFVRHEQNGRKEYTPGTIGDRIWKAAEALQAAAPNMPVVAEAVRIALPDVNPASVSAGLSHWRKFCGTLHTKSV